MILDSATGKMYSESMYSMLLRYVCLLPYVYNPTSRSELQF